jgi:multiple antibiotic resistance protein
MELNFKEIVTATMVLFAVIDIIGSIPIIIDLRKKVGHIQSEKASIVAACLMIAFFIHWRGNFKIDWNRHQFICRGRGVCFILFGFGNDLGHSVIPR